MLSIRHIEDVINGIAQDLYFHPTELNFYESRWQDKLMQWGTSKDTLRIYNEKISQVHDLSLFDLYGQMKLNWKGMDCNYLYIRGCKRESRKFLC